MFFVIRLQLFTLSALAGIHVVFAQQHLDIRSSNHSDSITRSCISAFVFQTDSIQRKVDYQQLLTMFSFTALQKTLANKATNGLGVLYNSDSVKGRLFYSGMDSMLLSSFNADRRKEKKKRQIMGLKFNGGSMAYHFNYRTNVDSQFLEPKIGQHQIDLRSNFLIANRLPITVSGFFRRSNSQVLPDLNDINIEFDINMYMQIFKQKIVTKNVLPLNYSEVALGGYRSSCLNTVSDLQNELKGMFDVSKLVLAYEVLNNPEVAANTDFAGGENKLVDSALNKAAAQQFIAKFEKAKQRLDTVEMLVKKLVNEIDSARQLIVDQKKKIMDYTNGKMVKSLSDSTFADVKNKLNLSGAQRFMLGIRKFALGRSTISNSGFVAEQTNVRGVNIEYNSKYYVAFVAGMLDLDFRNGWRPLVNRAPQFFSMLRFGIGNINSSHVIAGVFYGNKTTYNQSVSSSIGFVVQGYSLQLQRELGKAGSIKLEWAQTLSPDLRQTPVKAESWSLRNPHNQSYAVQLRYHFKKLNTKFFGAYKYTGINFQTFSIFQQNAAMQSIHIKWDQYLFNNYLKLQVNVKNADFTNPLIVRQYTNNTLFKSVLLSLKKRKWPTITAGVTPVSTVTRMGDLLAENRFQTLMLSVMHTYKIGSVKMITQTMFNEMYGNMQQKDSLAIGMGTQNFLFSQHIYFKLFSSGINVQVNSNQNFNLKVIDAFIQSNIAKIGAYTAGLKINDMNDTNVRVGWYFNYRLPVGKKMQCSASFEKGFMPTASGVLVNNLFGQVQLIKYLRP
jgi:hypothetical protein